MATTLHFTTGNEQQQQQGIRYCIQDSSQKPKRRSSGRRRNKPKDGQKKQVLRGMGVERLEKQRLEQERLNKMNLVFDPVLVTPSSSSSFNLHKFSGLPSGVIAQIPAQNLNHGYVGFREQMDIGGVVSLDQFKNDLFGIGGSVHVMPMELSSNPNPIKCIPEQCGACHKMQYVSDRVFMGLNIARNEENGDLPRNQTYHHIGHALGNENEGREAVAVHSRGVTSNGGGSTLMEYEFFPQTNTHDSGNFMKKESEMPGFDALNLNPIDLSLKLSY